MTRDIWRAVVVAGAMLGTTACGPKAEPVEPNPAQTMPADPCATDPCATDPCATNDPCAVTDPCAVDPCAVGDDDDDTWVDPCEEDPSLPQCQARGFILS